MTLSMIGRGEFEETVYVGGQPYVIYIHQKIKNVWVARGDYHGEQIEVKGSSLNAAAKAWADAASFRGN